MGYYNIEIFKGDTLIEDSYSDNDYLFLKELSRELSHTNTGFRDVIIQFYRHTSMDKLQWLHHTAQVVITIGDEIMTEYWLDFEITKVSTGEKVTAKSIMKKNYQEIVERRLNNDLGILLLEYCEPFGYKSAKSLSNIWYDLVDPKEKLFS